MSYSAKLLPIITLSREFLGSIILVILHHTHYFEFEYFGIGFVRQSLVSHMDNYEQSLSLNLSACQTITAPLCLKLP